MSLTDDELMAEFLAKGIVRIPVENQTALTMINLLVMNEVKRLTNDSDLNGFHLRLNQNELNDLRLQIIQRLNSHHNTQDCYFSLAKHALETLVGNELVMQRNINLSIQLPGDSSSLLPIHCDTWSGDSPYEVVLWVPLVDCHGTKSMFFVDADADAAIQPEMRKFRSAEDLYQAVKPKAKFIDCNYGECLIFTQNIMHGNRVNETNETRWSMNCRFKSALTPYADKKLGEFFEPITIRPATRLGARYELPRL